MESFGLSSRLRKNYCIIFIKFNYSGKCIFNFQREPEIRLGNIHFIKIYRTCENLGLDESFAFPNCLVTR